MHADLERLITLQHLDSAAHDAERRLAEEPARLIALDVVLDSARQDVVAAKEHLARNQTARREIEKDVAVHQGRLSKFRDQAMAVKTNQEYQAIQHEITFAQTGIKTLEDKILELMVEADDLSAGVKRTEAALSGAQKTTDADRKALTTERADLDATLSRLRTERADVVAAMDPAVLSIFELVAQRRNGVAVSEARDGICTICHVRLRPQVFNTVLRNAQIIQCDNCLRILFSAPRAVVDTAAPPPASL